MQKSSRFVCLGFFAVILVLVPQITFSFFFFFISKDVKFPLMLDVYELCTAELQEKMLPIRSKFKEMEDKKLEKQQQKVQPSTCALHLQRSSSFLKSVNVFPVVDKEA